MGNSEPIVKDMKRLVDKVSEKKQGYSCRNATKELRKSVCFE